MYELLVKQRHIFLLGCICGVIQAGKKKTRFIAMD